MRQLQQTCWMFVLVWKLFQKLFIIVSHLCVFGTDFISQILPNMHLLLFHRWWSWHSHFSVTNTPPLSPPGGLSAVCDASWRMKGSSLIWSGTLKVCMDFISSKWNLLIRIESVEYLESQLLWFSLVSSRPGPSLLLSVCQPWLSVSFHLLISSWAFYHRLCSLFLLYCLFSLFSVSLHLSLTKPPPLYFFLTLFFPIISLILSAWATCSEQVNKSLSSSGDDNKTPGILCTLQMCADAFPGATWKRTMASKVLQQDSNQMLQITTVVNGWHIILHWSASQRLRKSDRV